MARRGNTHHLSRVETKPNAYMLKFPGPEKGRVGKKSGNTQTVIHGLQGEIPTTLKIKVLGILKILLFALTNFSAPHHLAKC